MRSVTIKCFLRHYVLSITTSLCFVVFLVVFLAVGTIIALQFSESVFLECERDWFVKQSNERVPKKRWKFTYERSPVLTHRCMFTSFRIVFLYIEEIKRFPLYLIKNKAKTAM